MGAENHTEGAYLGAKEGRELVMNSDFELDELDKTDVERLERVKE